MRGLLLGLLLLICGSTFANAQDLSGRWYGEGYQLRRYLHWHALQAPDGELWVEFRQYEDCKLVDRSQHAGRWRLSGKILYTDIFMIDGAPSKLQYRYAIERYSGTEMEYRETSLGMLFKSRRVGEDFAWPDCDPSKLVS